MDSPSISEQIDRILRSHSFAGKAQLRKLLEVLARNIDSQATLTPDLVIKELWPDEIRTKRPADVATEMNRLRHALESYYKGEGRADPITIVLPNRAVLAPDGTHEKRWIVPKPSQLIGAAPPPAIEGHPSVRQAKPVQLLTILGAVAVLGVVGYIVFRMLALPAQPHAARLDGSALTIVDAEGKELWRKVFPQGFYDLYYKGGLATRIWFKDLEGKGHTSVLFLYTPGVEPSSHSTTLICYSDRGKEKWRWTPGRDLPELSGSPATYWTFTLAFSKPTDKKTPRIVVTSGHDYWYPDQIAILDFDGKALSEYWHSGHLQYLAVTDLDGDGREEIVAAGISNGYRQATLVVLDMDRVFGASAEPNRPELQIHGMGAAQERARLLFPRSDLNQALEVYNSVADMTVEHGTIRVAVQECQQVACLIMYELDRNLHLKTAYAADAFRRIHAEFYLKSKNPHPFSSAEQAELAKLRCLVGCKTEFITFGSP